MTGTADQTPKTTTAAATPTSAGASVLTESHEPAPVPAVAGAHAPVGVAHHPVDHDGEHGAHPTDAKYIKIAGILAVITAFEVAIYYVKSGLGDSFAPILIAMAAVKFFIVGAYFMHLRFDNRVLRRFFITGIVLAAVIYTILFLLLGVYSSSHGAHA
jgi:cytochrome c oxidase subunit 4